MLLQVFFHVDKLQMINLLTLKVKCVKRCQKYVFEEFYFVCFYFILTMEKKGYNDIYAHLQIYTKIYTKQYIQNAVGLLCCGYPSVKFNMLLE